MGNRQLIYEIALAAMSAVLFSKEASGQTPKPTLEKSLESQYALTTATADNTDIVTAGAVLTFVKRGFMAADAGSTRHCEDTYKEGQIKPSATCQVLGGKTVLGQHVGGSVATRTFVNGEKIFVTRIDVDRVKDIVAFELFSDAFNNVRYKGLLRVEFPKATLASTEFAQVQTVLNQIFTVTPPDTASAAAAPAAPGATPAPPAAPASAPPAIAAPVATPTVAPDAPPPPPPPDPKSISVGQTTDEVVAIMGQPEKKAKVAGKEIYFYKDMKVTFVNGKMTDAQ